MILDTGHGIHVACVFIVMTVKTKVFPVAPVRRVVIVVVVFVVYGQLVQVLPGEFASASSAHPGMNLEGSRSIVTIACRAIFDRFSNYGVEFVIVCHVLALARIIE